MYIPYIFSYLIDVRFTGKFWIWPDLFLCIVSRGSMASIIVNALVVWQYIPVYTDECGAEYLQYVEDVIMEAWLIYNSKIRL